MALNWCVVQSAVFSISRKTPANTYVYLSRKESTAGERKKAVLRVVLSFTNPLERRGIGIPPSIPIRLIMAVAGRARSMVVPRKSRRKKSPIARQPRDSRGAARLRD